MKNDFVDQIREAVMGLFDANICYGFYKIQPSTMDLSKLNFKGGSVGELIEGYDSPVIGINLGRDVFCVIWAKSINDIRIVVSSNQEMNDWSYGYAADSIDSLIKMLRNAADNVDFGMMMNVFNPKISAMNPEDNCD